MTQDEKIRRIETILLAEKPKPKGHPLRKYRSLLLILYCNGYAKSGMNKKLRENGLDFTGAQIGYYLNKYPFFVQEIEDTKRKITRLHNK